MQRITSPAEQDGWTRRDEWQEYLRSVQERREFADYALPVGLAEDGRPLCEARGCHKPFTPRSSNQRFCTPQCYTLDRRNGKVGYFCTVCKRSYDGYGKSHYCSDKCRKHAIKLQRRKQRGRAGRGKHTEGMGGMV